MSNLFIAIGKAILFILLACVSVSILITLIIEDPANRALASVITGIMTGVYSGRTFIKPAVDKERKNAK